METFLLKICSQTKEKNGSGVLSVHMRLELKDFLLYINVYTLRTRIEVEALLEVVRNL